MDDVQDDASRAEGNPRHGNSRRRHPHGHHNDEQAFYQGDTRAHDALHFISTVLQQMGMECRARLRRPREAAPEGQAPEIVIEVYGRDSGRIIGKRGQVLAALQFLTHRAVNRPDLERRHVVVDAEGYRLRRESTLANMARRLGQQAVDEGKIITFEPMNPRDRRVVHLALAKFDGVITKSEGEGDERRVQIIPVRR
jgi:spoIIIJ-associated protein